MLLRIRYRSTNDEMTERVISDVLPHRPHHLSAYCHLRGENRTFLLDRIESAVDLETGEPIADLWRHFGLPQGAPAPLELPTFPETPQRLGVEEARTLHKADKVALFTRFKVQAIAATKRRELESLFGSRCFACGAAGRLQLDHHVPQLLGGRLVPGNIVMLCGPCNMAKRDLHPARFYSSDQLEQLRPLLEAQLSLFDFAFDWSRWRSEPLAYLLSLGVPQLDAEAAIAERDDGFSVSIAMD